MTDPSTIQTIQTALNGGPIIIEHWHYRRGSAPTRRVFEEWEDFSEYLADNAYAGDAIDVWKFAEVCTNERRIAFGKCPADDGTVPSGGAY